METSTRQAAEQVATKTLSLNPITLCEPVNKDNSATFINCSTLSNTTILPYRDTNLTAYTSVMSESA